jgi:hypothetical protein
MKPTHEHKLFYTQRERWIFNAAMCGGTAAGAWGPLACEAFWRMLTDQPPPMSPMWTWSGAGGVAALACLFYIALRDIQAIEREGWKP